MESEINHFKYRGRDVRIYPLARILKPHVIEIDDYSSIDDFTYINGGSGVKIGKRVHISSFTSIVGEGELVIGDDVNIGCGTKIMTSIDTGEDIASAFLFGDGEPDVMGKIVIEKGVSIGNDVVIHPNVRIAERSVVDSYRHVLEDISPDEYPL